MLSYFQGDGEGFFKLAYLSQTCFVNAQTRTRVGLFPQQPNSLAKRQKDRVHLACHWGRRHRRQTKIPPFLSLATNRADGAPSPEVTKQAKRCSQSVWVFWLQAFGCLAPTRCWWSDSEGGFAVPASIHRPGGQNSHNHNFQFSSSCGSNNDGEVIIVFMGCGMLMNPLFSSL